MSSLVIRKQDKISRFAEKDCDLIAGGKDGLENDEKGIIDTCIKHIYDGYFKHPKPENMPILEDLYNALLKYGLNQRKILALWIADNNIVLCDKETG